MSLDRPPVETKVAVNETSTKQFHIEPLPEHLKMRKFCLEAPIAAAHFYQLWVGEEQPNLSLTRQQRKKSETITFVPEEKLTSTHPILFQRVHHYTVIEDVFQYPASVKQLIPFYDPKAQERFLHNHPCRLASISFMSLILGQSSLNPKRLGFDLTNKKFIAWDLENAFEHCWLLRKEVRSDLTEEKSSIDSIKINKTTGDIITDDKFLQTFQMSKNYLLEKYYTVFKFIFTPNVIIESIIKKYITHDFVAQSVRQHILSQKKLQTNYYLLQPNFRNYLFENHEKNYDSILKEFVIFLKNNKIAIDIKEVSNHLQTKITSVNTPNALENSILSSDESVEFKKEFIKSMKIETIKKQESMFDVFDIFKSLETLEKYQVIRERTGAMTTFDLKGNNYKGHPISETFSQLIEVTKLQMLLCALVLAKNEDDHIDLELLSTSDELKEFIGTQRHSSWLGYGPIFSALSFKTSSEKRIETAMDEKNFDGLISAIKNELTLKC